MKNTNLNITFNEVKGKLIPVVNGKELTTLASTFGMLGLNETAQKQIWTDLIQRMAKKGQL